MRATVGNYLRLLFAPFFRWWWTLITGAASILSFVVAPPNGVTLPRSMISLLVLVLFALVFLTLSVLYQGWELFEARFVALEVIAIQKCQDYGGEYLILLRGQLPASKGTLIEIRRPIGQVEAPFAIVELFDKNAQGYYQAKPIWVAPGHLRDFAAGRFVATELIADTYVDADRIRSNIEHFRPREA
jgi:hypothetical protein